MKDRDARELVAAALSRLRDEVEGAAQALALPQVRARDFVEFRHRTVDRFVDKRPLREQWLEFHRKLAIKK